MEDLYKKKPTAEEHEEEDIDNDNERYMFDEEGISTLTSEEQMKVESKVSDIFSFFDSVDSIPPKLLRKEHIQYLLNGTKSLSAGFQSLDASRPWICYWILHALDLLDGLSGSQAAPIVARTIDFLSRCQHPSGGFGGGPGQVPHLAPTYAAVNALMICGTEEAYKVINREAMYKFLLSVKDPQTGAFFMHKDGEIDVRGSYTAMSVATLLNIVTPELASGAGEFVARCQTYEGGMGGYPGNEAHGGKRHQSFPKEKEQEFSTGFLLNSSVHRQMPFESGFQGRTNKLVDACYSFWQGGLFPLIDMIEKMRSPQLKVESDKDILICCQDKDGGLRDKPGKSRDFYHTCYALSGLSSSQHNKDGSVIHIGSQNNLMKPTHPVHNISPDKVVKALNYFHNKQ